MLRKLPQSSSTINIICAAAGGAKIFPNETTANKQYKLDGLLLHQPPVRNFLARVNAVGGKGGGISSVTTPNIQRLRVTTPDTETSPNGKAAAPETGMPPGPTQESCAERGSVKRPNLL